MNQENTIEIYARFCLNARFPGLSEDDALDKMLEVVSAIYRTVDTGLNDWKINVRRDANDDFDIRFFELCKNDGEIKSTDVDVWEMSITFYGCGEWFNEKVKNDIMEKFNGIISQFSDPSVDDLKISHIELNRKVETWKISMINV